VVGHKEELYMATWNDVKNFLKSGLNAQEVSNGNGVTADIKYTDGRSQFVNVMRQEYKGAEWIDIFSGIGKLNAANLNTALEAALEATCGGIVKIGDNYAVRHCIPIADLSNEEIIGPMTIVASVADSLEEKLVGGDNF
jgi:hypothetical protein